MSSKYRALSALMAAVTLSAFFAACGGSSEGPAPSQTAAPSGGDGETTEAPETSILDGLDFSGADFRVSMSDTDISSAEFLVGPEEQTGDIVDDAQYKRNLIIEEKYNIKISDSYIPMASYSELTSTFKKSVMASSDDFDVCRLIMRDAFSLALSGYVLPVDSLPYADLDNPWYVKFVNDALRISGKYYVVYNDECMDTFTGAIGEGEFSFADAVNQQLQLLLSLSER